MVSSRLFVLLIVVGCMCYSTACSSGGYDDAGMGPLSRAQFEETTSALTGARQIYETTLSQSTPTLALQAALDWIVTQPGIAEAHIGQDGSTLSFRHASDLKGTLKTRRMDGEENTLRVLQRAETSTLSATLGTGKKAFVAEAPVFRAYDIGNDLANNLEAAGFDVHHLANLDFTREELKNMGEFDVAIIRGHGSVDWWGNFSIAIGEKASWLDTMQENFAHWDLDGVGVTSTAGDEAIGTFYDIYPKFFERNVSFESRSVVYLSSCMGLKNDSLAKVLVAKGLGVLLGWSDTLSSKWDYEHTAEPLINLLLKGASVSAALKELPGTDPDFGRSEWMEKDSNETIRANLLTYPSSPSELRIVPGCDDTEDCSAADETCQDHQCSFAGCTPKVRRGCCGNRVCWFDSCDNQGDVIENCSIGCQGGECVSATCPDTKDCSGRTCGQDPVCGLSCGICSGDLECVEGNCQETDPTCSRIADLLPFPQDMECVQCETGMWDRWNKAVDTKCVLDCLEAQSSDTCDNKFGLPEMCPHCFHSCGPYSCNCVPDMTVMGGKQTSCLDDADEDCSIMCQLQNGDLCAELSGAALAVCPRLVKAGVLSATLRGRHMNVGPANIRIRLPDGTVDDSTAKQTVKADGTMQTTLTFPLSRPAGNYTVWAESNYDMMLTDEFVFTVR